MTILKTDKKQFTKDATQRFLLASKFIIGNRSSGKIVQADFCEKVELSPSNLIRMRKDPDMYNVTVEQCCNAINHYQISAAWLLMGIGDMYGNAEVLAAYNVLDKRIQDIEKSLQEIEVLVPKIKGLIKK